MSDYLIIEKDERKRNSAKNSLMRKTNSGVGICEQLRLIYDSIYKLPDGELKTKVTEQLVDAIIMAKKMSDRLAYYFKTYKDMTGHQGKNILLLDHGGSRMRMRRRRIC